MSAVSRGSLERKSARFDWAKIWFEKTGFNLRMPISIRGKCLSLAFGKGLLPRRAPSRRSLYQSGWRLAQVLLSCTSLQILAKSSRSIIYSGPIARVGQGEAQAEWV